MKNVKLDNCGIITPIENDSTRKEWKSIGKRKWYRSCPNCKNKIGHVSYRSFKQCKDRKLVCRSCCQLGKSHPHSEKHKKYMSELMTGRQITWSDKIKKHHWSKNPELRKRICENQSRLICDLIQSGKLNSRNKNFKHGYFYNNTTGKKEFYRSSYEKNRMEKLNADVNVRKWTTKHNIRIPYEVNGEIHYYLPDFFIMFNSGEVIIEEIKGYVNDKNLLKRKINAARKYCKKFGIKYKITYDNYSQK